MTTEREITIVFDVALLFAIFLLGGRLDYWKKLALSIQKVEPIGCEAMAGNIFHHLDMLVRGFSRKEQPQGRIQVIKPVTWENGEFVIQIVWRNWGTCMNHDSILLMNVVAGPANIWTKNFQKETPAPSPDEFLIEPTRGLSPDEVSSVLVSVAAYVVEQNIRRNKI